MKEKITKYKRYIISIALILMLSVLFINMKYLLPKKYEEIPEVKLKEMVNKDKAMAIMISNDGNNYQEYKSDTWPGNGYKFKEAKCIDNNGSEIKEAVTYENGKITLTTNKTIYCTLYFDYKGTINILRENDPNKVLSSTEVGGMYRYQGVGTEEGIDDTHKFVDNNYICFGTDNKEKCTNDEDHYMYRIIGITEEGQLYLIKMKGVEEGNNKIFQWNSKYQSPDCDGNACEWPNADIYKRLNGTNSNGNPVFVNNSIYEYMVDGNIWYSKIENHNWMYGDVDGTVSYAIIDGETVYGVRNNGLILYEIESGIKPTRRYEKIDGNWQYVKHQWSSDKSVYAKIGLMYLHDYSLAYDIERNWYNDYDANNWLFINNNKTTTDWLITNQGGYSDGRRHAWIICDNGWIDQYTLTTRSTIRPTFYLSSTIKIASGSGTISDPYILNLSSGQF